MGQIIRDWLTEIVFGKGVADRKALRDAAAILAKKEDE